MPDSPDNNSAAIPTPADPSVRPRSWLPTIVLIILTLLFVAQAALSLDWRIQHDAPIMLYIAFLMDSHQAVPYRDIIDFNLPGTYLHNRLLARVFGYGDLGFRCADLVQLGLLFTVTWVWLRRFGAKAVWCATVLFGLVYFHFGPDASMQREYIALLPISAALAVAVTVAPRSPRVAQLLVGVLFGVAATVKPHLPMALPLVVLVQLHPTYSLKRVVVAGALALAGLAAPPLATGIYLWCIGAWPDFMDIATHYWPLYGSLGGDFELRSGLAQFANAILSFGRLAGQGLLLIPASIGAYLALRKTTLPAAQRRLVVLLIGLAAVYLLYPAFALKFWSYHWIPFLYFVCVLAALCFATRREVVSPAEQRGLAAVVLLCALLAASPNLATLHQVTDRAVPTRQTRVDQIATFLSEHLDSGDTVQPLDWTGGAVHALLIARAPLATPFLYDFYFYHHVSDPYIQDLRKRFLDALRSAKPRFIVRMTADRPWPRGSDTSKQFSELEVLLLREYRIALRGDGYAILERKRDSR